MKFAFIQAHASEHAISTLCRVLTVSKAGYYAWCARRPSARAVETAALTTAIAVTYHAARQRYGSPRVHHELRAHGRRHGRKRIAQIMQQQGWRAVAPKRYRVTTSATRADVAPNVLARAFAPAQQAACNRAWVSDITYIATRAGFCYLAVVLDLASRRVVGWAVRDTLEEALTLEALRRALAQRRPPPGLVHHSDQGGQYRATAYRALLATHAITASMSRRANCWDNAVAESFFATIKRECLARRSWTDEQEVRHALHEYIDYWYNPHRRHSSLAYHSPVAYEQQLNAA